MASVHGSRLGASLSSCRRPTAIVICVLCLVWPPALAANMDLLALDQPSALARPAITDLAILPAAAVVASSALVVLSAPRPALQPTACNDLSSIIAYDLNITIDNDSGLVDGLHSADEIDLDGHLPDTPPRTSQLVSCLNRIAQAGLLIAFLAVFSLLRHSSASTYHLLSQRDLTSVYRLRSLALDGLALRFSSVYERISSVVARHRIAFAAPYEDRIAHLDNNVARLQRSQLRLLAELCAEKQASSLLRADIASARAKLTDNEARFVRAELDVLAMNKQLIQVVTASDEAIQILRDNAGQLDACLHDALNELTLAREENVCYSTRIAAADGRVQCLLAERSELKKALSDLDARYVAQRDSSVASLALVAEEKSHVDRQLAAAQEETQRVQQQLADVTRSLVEVRADSEALLSQLSSEQDRHAREVAELRRVREASYASFTAHEAYLCRTIDHLRYLLQQWYDAYPDALLPVHTSTSWDERCVVQPPVDEHPETALPTTHTLSDFSPPSSPPPPHVPGAIVATTFEHSESSAPSASPEGGASDECSGLDDDDPVYDVFTLEDLNVAPDHVRRSAFLFQDVPDGFAIVIDAPPVEDTDSAPSKDEPEDWTPDRLGVFPRYRQWGRRILRGYDDDQNGRVWEIWEGTGPGRGWHRVVSHCKVAIDPVTQMEKSEYIGYTYHNVRVDGQAVWVRDHVPDDEDFARVHPDLVDRLAALAL